MVKESVAQATSGQNEEAAHTKDRLGPILCWAVVFADIGTSIYYVPGILYGTVGKLAGFFVMLTMLVFILLTFKYVEVTYRFPQGGGVVTVAAQAMNRWFGALGGMFILVDYFLTSAISSLSGILYLSVVLPAIGPQIHFLGFSITLWITLIMLVLLGILNWYGVSESAKFSLVGAIIAFGSDIAILITVFTHISFGTFLSLFPKMFVGHALTPVSILVGFAGSFLAFSGLESISQLSPVMKVPRRMSGKMALFLVVLTVGLTSPLLTVLSTQLLPSAAGDPVRSSQIISLLAGHWGNIFLQIEVAISASALLVFASNTAIIGSYHVFLALARMEFFPSFVTKRNKLRGTPHYSIALATAIPMLVLILVAGNINILGDMYAFGLLGAFTLTCLGMDIVRYRERKIRREPAAKGKKMLDQDASKEADKKAASEDEPEPEGIWTRSMPNFILGILTTVLVVIAWSTNLIYKPLATAFGGSVALLGMIIAYLSYRQHRQRGDTPATVVTTGVEVHLPHPVLAILLPRTNNNAVIEAAVNNKEHSPVIFMYVGNQSLDDKPELFDLIAPHLEDKQAREVFSRAKEQAEQYKLESRFVYRRRSYEAVYSVWQSVEAIDTIIDTDRAIELQGITPDNMRYERNVKGEVLHMYKTWSKKAKAR